MADAEMEARRQEQDEADAEAEAIAEVEDASDNQFAQADADLPLFDAQSNIDEADAMRAMGFSEQKIEEHAIAQRSRVESQDCQDGGGADAAEARSPQEGSGQRASPPSEDPRGGSPDGQPAGPRAAVELPAAPSTEGVYVSGFQTELPFGPLPPSSLDALDTSRKTAQVSVNPA